MCLLLFAYNIHRDYPLILAANRDELYARPAREAQFWKDDPSILAGKDLQAGGTWLGISREGRIAAVTNFHEDVLHHKSTKSRGSLVTDFLRTKLTPQEYGELIVTNGGEYQGFTLVFGTLDALYSCSNKTKRCEELFSGVHGLSNFLLNDKSYKVLKGTEALRNLLTKSDGITHDDLFSLLGSRMTDVNAEPRSMNFGSDSHHIYSSLFIKGEEFGTRCSTAVLVDNRQRVFFAEKTFSAEGNPLKTVQHEFSLPN